MNHTRYQTKTDEENGTQKKAEALRREMNTRPHARKGRDPLSNHTLFYMFTKTKAEALRRELNPRPHTQNGQELLSNHALFNMITRYNCYLIVSIRTSSDVFRHFFSK